MSAPVHVIRDTTGRPAAATCSPARTSTGPTPKPAGLSTPPPAHSSTGPAPGPGVRITQLPGVAVLDLELPTTLGIAADTTGPAHTLYTARATPDRPAGAPRVATTAPGAGSTGRAAFLWKEPPGAAYLTS